MEGASTSARDAVEAPSPGGWRWLAPWQVCECSLAALGKMQEPGALTVRFWSTPTLEPPVISTDSSITSMQEPNALIVLSRHSQNSGKMSSTLCSSLLA